MSLCFIDSHWALHRGEITRQEFLANLVAHFTGLRHTIRPTPSSDPTICPDATYSPFASSLRKAALEHDYEPVAGMEIWRLSYVESDDMF